MKKAKAKKRTPATIIGPGGGIIKVADLEKHFESLNHKYNYIRKYFAMKRQRGAPVCLFYQPDILAAICREFTADKIIEAINETTSQSRGNYFKYFAGIFFDEVHPGGYIHYSLNEHKKEEGK